MSQIEGLLPCMFPHEVKRGVFLDIDEEDFGIIRAACSDCGACGPYVSIERTKATDEEKREAVRLWNILARTPSPSGAREMLALEYEADGLPRIASEIRACGTSNGLADDTDAAIKRGIRAIASALRSQGRGEGE